MITKKALAIRAAKASQPQPVKVSKSKKGCHNLPCTHPEHQVRCISLATGDRRCECGQRFPPLTDCPHPRITIAVAKRIGAAVCQRCGKTLVEGVPADPYGDPLDKNAVVVQPDLSQYPLTVTQVTKIANVSLVGERF